jgi:hypothetical protein
MRHIVIYESFNIGEKRHTSFLPPPPNIASIGNFDSCKQLTPNDMDRFVDHCCWFVLANQGKSKRYTDVNPLDGGTVGISHFAVGGLKKLYLEIGDEKCKKYWGVSAQELADNYGQQCRPDGKKGDDTGWGCYSGGHNPLGIDWKKGMTDFVNDINNNPIQDAATRTGRKKAIKAAMDQGWKTPFEWAVAVGISNSRGNGGFKKLASANGWDASKTLDEYVKIGGGQGKHNWRRSELIKKFYPQCESSG